jgi:replication factor A1
MTKKMNVSELEDRTAVDEIHVTVVEVKEARKTDYGPIQTVDVEDETGGCNLTLWNDQVGTLTEGDQVTIRRGWCKEYKGQKQISTGKYGQLTKEATASTFL